MTVLMPSIADAHAEAVADLVSHQINPLLAQRVVSLVRSGSIRHLEFVA